MEPTTVERITFSEALQRTTRQRRHLLLGNGFSIGVHPAFGYPSLFEDAVSRDPTLRALFPPGDSNFEIALERCEDVADADRLRQALIGAVAAVHPEHSLSLTEEQCLNCRDFLEHFVGRHRNPAGTMFTTNYDMLLHWVLSRQGKNAGTKQRSQLKCWDGFDSRGEWKEVQSQAYYLHGAVHIYQFAQPRFPDRTYTKMLRYEWGRPLTKQVDAEMRCGHLPVFIAEGNSQKKKASQRGEYLAAAKARFRGICRRDSEAALFAFGHSFGASDDHIADEIGGGTLRDIYVGTYSPTDVARVSELAATWAVERARVGGPSLTVHSFESAECAVWTAKRSLAA